jgi:hypothetical protein
MPLSIWQGMEDCLQAITERRPRAVLDAGIGFGLWGHLLRQYLDVWSGRIHPEQWTTRIDGIEIAEPRVQAHARYLYSNVYIGDIRELVPARAEAQRYDVILFGDVLEHLPKDDALALLETSLRLAGSLVVVRIPMGEGWRREGREPPDHHRSQWSPDDFMGYPATLRLYDYIGNPYALVTIETGRLLSWDDVEQRLQRIEARLEKLLAMSAEEEYP